MVTKKTAPRARGRPRQFAPEDALEAAMRVFWAQGYDGASIDALVAATGLTRSSLYLAWGGKEALFLAAVEHYAETRLKPLLAALGGGGALADDLGAFFDGVVRLATEADAHRGCLVSCALADAAGARATMRAELARRFAAVEARLEARLARAEAAGETPRSVAPGALAAMLAAVARGLMLGARAGADPETLRRTAAAARTLAAPASGEQVRS